MFNRATHFSIVWAMVLAVLTIVEWNNLDRDPMTEQIFLPFIERDIQLSMTNTAATGELGNPDSDVPEISSGNVGNSVQTVVEIDFNGPLFLAYFFGPILIFHAVGLIWQKVFRAS
jgi:hypothetical protein